MENPMTQARIVCKAAPGFAQSGAATVDETLPVPERQRRSLIHEIKKIREAFCDIEALCDAIAEHHVDDPKWDSVKRLAKVARRRSRNAAAQLNDLSAHPSFPQRGHYATHRNRACISRRHFDAVLQELVMIRDIIDSHKTTFKDEGGANA
jgi:hypothetical protein